MDTIASKTMINSKFLDDLVRYVLKKDHEGALEIPSKLNSRAAYGRRLSEEYRQVDLDHMLAYIDTFHLTALELAVLDNLAIWSYRNSGTLVRSALGLIGSTVTLLLSTVTELDAPVAAKNSSTLVEKFINEDAWVIRRVIRNAVATGPVEAKLPLRDLDIEFSRISRFSQFLPDSVRTIEKARLARLFPITTVETPISLESDRTEYVVRMLIQLTRAVNEYKRDEEFGKLRSFMTNCIHFSGMLRILSTDDEVIRLAGDVLDQAHSADRLLSSNCVAAAGLLTRMGRGELVYDEIMDLSKHQHRIMAVEVSSVIGLFSYLVSQSKDLINANSDVYKMFSRLIRYSGVGTRYTHEIQVVNED